MAVPGTQSEPYEISARFYHALRATALRLEANARKDEVFAASLDHPDHLQRQKRLVKAQRDQARRLWTFLTRSRVRDPEPAAS
jgi:hypothetical protein